MAMSRLLVTAPACRSHATTRYTLLNFTGPPWRGSATLKLPAPTAALPVTVCAVPLQVGDAILAEGGDALGTARIGHAETRPRQGRPLAVIVQAGSVQGVTPSVPLCQGVSGRMRKSVS